MCKNFWATIRENGLSGYPRVWAMDADTQDEAEAEARELASGCLLGQGWIEVRDQDPAEVDSDFLFAVYPEGLFIPFVPRMF